MKVDAAKKMKKLEVKEKLGPRESLSSWLLFRPLDSGIECFEGGQRLALLVGVA